MSENVFAYYLSERRVVVQTVMALDSILESMHNGVTVCYPAIKWFYRYYFQSSMQETEVFTARNCQWPEKHVFLSFSVHVDI